MSSERQRKATEKVRDFNLIDEYFFEIGDYVCRSSERGFCFGITKVFWDSVAVARGVGRSLLV
ncbi:hypothetical protein [Pelagicoccus sp. SDUM812003]|uniref:hypothetical protein n=1 Tax=Pelagicoccus sp. SDUM812003 TaxID=3041267 RepID=UPI00280F522F|nr:hypothetical protein [Pelagicoccus sp. SDUM812003]MDQ8204714.1 hypothetical protein [Pelagicoccus sp. SDUM812003]